MGSGSVTVVAPAHAAHAAGVGHGLVAGLAVGLLVGAVVGFVVACWLGASALDASAAETAEQAPWEAGR